MRKLTAVCCGWGERWPLGTLAENDRHLLFEYSPEAISAGIEFSARNLKLQKTAYGNSPVYQFRLPGLLADALPDGWGLLLMNRFFKKHLGRDPQQISSLERLAFMGERAMGAFAFEPAADLELPLLNLELLTLAKEVKNVNAGQDITALRELIMVGGSPQGARPKALVQYDAASNLVSTREDGPGTPWLIKFPGKDEHREVCAVEDCYSKLAHECDLDMPATRYFELSRNHAAFGIERFDRHRGMRVPIHTLAGALDTDYRIPSTSYQTFLRMTRFLTHSELEVRKAFERCVFNVAFNNRDDHSKNFSYRMDETFSWKLAPCYDLTYCVGPGGEHQMDIEGEGRNPGSSELLKLGTSNNLDTAWARQTIDRIAEVAGKFEGYAKNYEIRNATRKKIVGAIEDNRKRMS